MQQYAAGLGVEFNAIARQILVAIENRHHCEQQWITSEFTDRTRIFECVVKLLLQPEALVFFVFGRVVPVAEELENLRVVEVLQCRVDEPCVTKLIGLIADNARCDEQRCFSLTRCKRGDFLDH